LTEGLKDLQEYLQLPIIPNDRDHNFMMYPVVLKHGNKKDLVHYLETNLIETRDMMPLLNQPIYRSLFGDIEDSYPIAKWINTNGFYIGCHQYIKVDELDYTIEILHVYFKKMR
jgi:dTDP-4-amino-4,6-dideoxygalactose transaminase